eukprot:7391126-Prymnesium_polylepis.2
MERYVSTSYSRWLPVWPMSRNSPTSGNDGAKSNSACCRCQVRRPSLADGPHMLATAWTGSKYCGRGTNVTEPSRSRESAAGLCSRLS